MGKGKWEKRDQKKLLLAEFQGTFVLVIIKKYKLSCFISDIKVTRNGTSSFVKEFKTTVNCDGVCWEGRSCFGVLRGSELFWFAGGPDILRYSIQLSICILNSTFCIHYMSLLEPKMIQALFFSVRHLLNCDAVLSDECSARIFKAEWLLSWKQTQHIPGKLREISTSLHGVTFQRMWSSKSVSIHIDKIYLLLTLFRTRQSWLSFSFALSVQPVNTSAGCTQALLYTSLPIHANSGASVVKYTLTNNIQWWHRKQSSGRFMFYVLCSRLHRKLMSSAGCSGSSRLGPSSPMLILHKAFHTGALKCKPWYSNECTLMTCLCYLLLISDCYGGIQDCHQSVTNNVNIVVIMHRCSG